MEIPSGTAEISKSNTFFTKKKGLALIAVLVLLAGAAGLYIYNNYAIPNKSAQYQFEVNGLQRLYIMAGTNDRAVYVPVTIDTDTLKRLPVIDSEIASDGRTYLIAQETSTQANVFVFDGQKYVRITNSPTIKRSLSVDVASQIVGFEATELPQDSQDQTSQMPLTWNFVVADITDGTERIVMQGTQKAKILEGGREAFVVVDNKLNLVPITGGMPAELMQVYSAHTVAFNEDGSKIAALNPISKTINTYSYSKQSGLSFLTASDVQEQVPVSLSFKNNEVIAVYAPTMDMIGTQTQERLLLTRKNLSTNEEESIPLLSVGALLSEILYE